LAVIVGAALKYVLNEGLARWQLVTGDTLLEGVVAHFGRPVLWFFFGYWIREEGHRGADQIRTCRIDLATGYIMTAFFGLAMVIIGNQTGAVPGTGATLVANLADVLKTQLGSIGMVAKWAFLVGAWGAVFSSLLKWYSIVGALFIPMLALALLFLNGHSKWITKQYRNSWFTSVLLIITLLLFLWAGWFTIQSALLG